MYTMWWAFGEDGTCGVKGELCKYRSDSASVRGFALVCSSEFFVICSSEHGV